MRVNIINILFTTPLEQFQVVPILKINLGFFELVITNATVMTIMGVIGVAVLLYCIGTFFRRVNLIIDSRNDLTLTNFCFYIVPTRFQGVIEILQKFILSLIGDNIKNKDAQYYFPIVFFLFLYISLLNLIGLVPYSFTLTSQLIVTLTLSVSVFIGINIVSFRKHGVRAFAMFLPANTPFVLGLLLVPVELISYIFKPISLAIRLFANMMAGHTLLKVIAGFAFTLMGYSGILFLMHSIPLVVLFLILGLELGIALIQSFVFSLLICIYLNDALNLH